MKKMSHRIFALMLVCMLFASMVLSVSAAEVDPESDAMSVELENGPEAGYVVGARISGLSFTMVAQNVTSFLSSMAADKGFVPKDYDGKTIWVRGTLYHSVSGGSIRAGICYYDSALKKYIPGVYRDVGSGQYFNVCIAASSLYLGKTYYGYIRNNSSSGAVNGGQITVSAE